MLQKAIAGISTQCQCLARIYFDALEETVKNLLQSLGKLNDLYLTIVEEKLLSLSEHNLRIYPLDATAKQQVRIYGSAPHYELGNY
ncbi:MULTISPECIES: CRISPR-associated endonuclease Cas2 [Nostoc]|uniref:CRISPR-associated endonuclease Cas2 n=1 Tax=Nostoc TaxID=1177 RepID=UPI001F554C87|nr:MULTISPECIES: CRISPR-associated endonuclease Cas2 [Nostoc]